MGKFILDSLKMDTCKEEVFLKKEINLIFKAFLLKTKSKERENWNFHLEFMKEVSKMDCSVDKVCLYGKMEESTKETFLKVKCMEKDN